MTQFSVLTSDAKAIVVNFFNSQMKKSICCEPNKQLMVSLYSLMPGVDSKVISILDEYMISLSDHFLKSEIELLKSEYSAVVKFCYDHKEYGGVSTRRNGELHMPQSLIDLCMGIAQPKAGSSVLVPYSGDGSFAYHVSDCMVDGFETNEVSWAFSQVLLHSQHAVTSIKLQNNIDSDSKQYEYIFSFPPMLQGRDGRKVVDLVYDLITKRLQEKGELYCILPMNFCSIGSGWFEVRKILWDYRGQYSALVVSLPPILQPMSGISLCLLYVKKNHKDIVALMDATGDEFSARRDVAGYKEHTLKVQSIIETINSQDEKYVWVGTSKDLIGDVNLQPSRYLLSQNIPSPKKGERSIKLSDIIQTVPLSRRDEATLQIIARRNRLAHSSSEDESVDSKEREMIFEKYRDLEKQSCPLIGMRELSTSYLNCDINRDTLDVSGEVIGHILTTDCILIGFIGGKFKVGRLHGVTSASPVSLRNEVIPIKLSSDVVTEDFLLRCIMSEPTERQARMLATGTTISRLSKQDLLSIVINVPELKEQQDAICKEDTRSSLTEADRKLIESYEEFRKDMHMKKHAIGQTLFNINNWWNLLKLARDKGNGVVDDRTELGSNRKIKVADIYTNLEIAMAKLNIQLSKFDTGYGMQTENIPLTQFIEQYILEHKSPVFEYIYDKRPHRAESDMPEMDIDEKTMTAVFTGKYILREGDPLEYAVFAPEALTIVFNNIISNACAHGFKENGTERNLIRIEILSEGTDYVIAISNNGEPIKEFTPQEVLTYGLTTEHSRTTDVSKNHFGIGGYEVKKLMTEFNGDVEIISTPDEEFTVTYRLVFHNTNVKYVF